MCNNRHSPLKTRTAFLALLVTTAAAPATDGCSLPESVAPLLNWHECVKHSVKVLADQPEPANSVATAVLAVCVQYELAFAQAAGGGSCGADYADGAKKAIMEQAIAQIMTLRAGRAPRVPQRNAPSSPVDHNRM
jgi:hypothetical protein